MTILNVGICFLGIYCMDPMKFWDCQETIPALYAEK